MPGKLAGLRHFINTRRADIEKETADGMPIWTAAAGPPPQLQAPNGQGRGNPRAGNAERGKKNAGGKSATNTIWLAAKTGDLQAVAAHLGKGADVNARGPEGTPLSLATLAGKDKVLEFLLSKGAEVNAVNDDGNAALHAAAFLGHVGAVKTLLKNGAAVNARNKEGNTPLHAAAFLGRIEIVALLIKNKANVNTKNDDGETPLESVTSDWTEALQKGTQFTANVLKIKVDMGELKAARPGIAEMLRKHGGKTSEELK
jgi:hypothetical protein